MNEQNISIRLLILITTPKFADKAKKMLNRKRLPIQYSIHAKGTATSEIMDALGLGSPDKSVVISAVPQNAVSEIFEELTDELNIKSVNGGIAFTIPLTGTTQLLIKMMKEQENEQSEDFGKGDIKMTNKKYSMIAAVVNRGYSADVMEAAKSAGASGGTVINSHRITDKELSSVWGLSVQEEKEIVLIVAGSDNKVDIMKKISESCGMHSEAKGIILSFPIEDAIGLSGKRQSS